MRAYLAQLDLEAARVRADSALAGSPLKDEMLDAIARQKELSQQLAGKFVQGRLADTGPPIAVLPRARAALIGAMAPPAAPAPQDDADARADRKRDELIEDLRAIIPRMPEGARGADLWV